MKRIFLVLLVVFTSSLLFAGESGEGFRFVYFTDVHLEEGKNAVQGFEKAIKKINALNPDFWLPLSCVALKDAFTFERVAHTAFVFVVSTLSSTNTVTLVLSLFIPIFTGLADNATEFVCCVAPAFISQVAL